MEKRGRGKAKKKIVGAMAAGSLLWEGEGDGEGE